MSKRSRDKGARSEREVARILRAILAEHGIDAQRILTETRDASFDVELTDEDGQLPYAIQVKNHKNDYAMWLVQGYREARDLNPDLWPVGVGYVPVRKGTSRPREWVATIPLELLARLIAGIAAIDPSFWEELIAGKRR